MTILKSPAQVDAKGLTLVYSRKNGLQVFYRLADPRVLAGYRTLRLLADIAHSRGALVHTDAAQAVGKLTVRVDDPPPTAGASQRLSVGTYSRPRSTLR